jgi:hypothetical protein
MDVANLFIIFQLKTDTTQVAFKIPPKFDDVIVGVNIVALPY